MLSIQIEINKIHFITIQSRMNFLNSFIDSFDFHSQRYSLRIGYSDVKIARTGWAGAVECSMMADSVCDLKRGKFYLEHTHVKKARKEPN